MFNTYATMQHTIKEKCNPFDGFCFMFRSIYTRQSAHGPAFHQITINYLQRFFIHKNNVAQ